MFFKISNKKGTDQDCAQSIKHLSAWLHRAYNKPVYILLDEYDTPLHAAYTDNFYDEMIAFIRSFMVQSFKDNPNLKQAVVIGILKVAQESIFSDFNNPAVSTVLERRHEGLLSASRNPKWKKWPPILGLESRLDGIQSMVQRLHLRRATRSSTILGVIMSYLQENIKAGFLSLLGAHQCQQDGQGNAAVEQKGQPGNHGEAA